jgi:endo-1,4-beta-xylanase
VLRRDFTKLLLTSAGARAAEAAEPGLIRLRDIGAERGLLVGSAVSHAALQRPAFTNLLAEQASIVVPENEMKWARIHPEPDRYDFSQGDALVDFASAHRQKVRGHNLCWHEHNPDWLERIATRENAADLLRAHIGKVAAHFAGRIHSWDVVNEAIAVEDARADGLRNSIWLRLIGPEYLDIAFRAAAAADSHAMLTYNDYDLEQDTPQHQRKREAVLRLLRSLREGKAPIHALGMQSHLKAGANAAAWSGLHAFLDRVAELDLQIFVTELDVDDNALASGVAARDRAVGQLYRDFLTNVLQHRQIKAVLTWGLIDSDSWLNHSKPRSDGLPQRPLPFDADLKPTPAFYAMRDAIAASTSR